MSSVRLVLGFALLSVALCQEFSSDCPEPNGYFADAVQCDKYYACEDNVLTEKLCSDGMVFNDLNPRAEVCTFPFAISCAERPELQPPKPSKHCPRQNGYFTHEDPTICNRFYFCSQGTGSAITCPETLVFSEHTGTCVWPDEAGRTGCSSEKVLNFTCPKVEFEVAVAHPRYADPLDCQFFYVCINGDSPRRNGCKFGQVFNSKTTTCGQPIEVPECQDYYKEYFEEYFAGAEGGRGAPSPDVLAAAIGSGFAPLAKPKRVQIIHDPEESASAIDPPKRRPVGSRPSVQSVRKPVDTVPAAATRTDPSPTVQQSARPRRPNLRPNQRTSPGVVSNDTPSRTSPVRRPVRRRRPVGKLAATTTTTTTTTTPAPAPALEDDYYYYDYVDGETPVEGSAPPA